MIKKFFELFKRKEPEMTPAIKKFADRVDKWYNDHPEVFIGCPTTEAQEVVNCLEELFLGTYPDWYIEFPVTNAQGNTIILNEILLKYCKAYRKRRNKND